MPHLHLPSRPHTTKRGNGGKLSLTLGKHYGITNNGSNNNQRKILFSRNMMPFPAKRLSQDSGKGQRFHDLSTHVSSQSNLLLPATTTMKCVDVLPQPLAHVFTSYGKPPPPSPPSFQLTRRLTHNNFHRDSSSVCRLDLRQCRPACRTAASPFGDHPVCRSNGVMGNWTRASVACLPLLLKYLHGQDRYRGVNVRYVAELWNRGVNIAASRGHLPTLDSFTRYVSDIVITDALEVAARNGLVHVIVWLRNRGPLVC